MLDRLIPRTHEAYWICCMPHGAKPVVVERVASDLKMEVGNALKEPKAQVFFHSLAKSAYGQLRPKPIPLIRMQRRVPVSNMCELWWPAPLLIASNPCGTATTTHYRPYGWL